MLVVKLEIHSSGYGKRPREIGRLEIADITDLASVSDYSYQLWADGVTIATGLVGNHPRERGAWLLVARALYDSLHDIVAHGRGVKHHDET